MTMNRAFFFEHVRTHLFGGAIKASQKAGLTAILDKWDKTMAASDDRWLAYMLGTAHHETGRTMQPVRETFASTDDRAATILEKAWKQGKLPWVSQPYWHKDANGHRWLGRGFVQITHKSNYSRLSTATGVDILSDPTAAMKLNVALDIMFIGMINGLFTGKKLSNYFNTSKKDWFNARRIINGIERAALVEDYAKSYYGGISYTT